MRKILLTGWLQSVLQTLVSCTASLQRSRWQQSPLTTDDIGAWSAGRAGWSWRLGDRGNARSAGAFIRIVVTTIRPLRSS